MKKTLALGVIASLAIALSGCTDSEATPSPSSTDSDLRPVRVAALPITETAALWGGIAAGIFERHGLAVEVLPAQGGAYAIPAMINGDIEFAVGQPFGPFRADLQDLGVVMIGNYASSYADGEDINAVVASAASGITRPAELAGRKVSVNSLGAAGDVTIMALGPEQLAQIALRREQEAVPHRHLRLRPERAQRPDLRDERVLAGRQVQVVGLEEPQVR